MENKVYNVLVLCTGNSARSIMAEGLLNIMGKGRFKAFSAGSSPTGRVNPFAVELLQSIGYPTSNLRSKSWDEFSQPNSPHMDMVITVCDNAASEVCPIWLGSPVTAHWGFEDPAAVQGSDEEKRATFKRIFLQIRNRVDIFLQLPVERMHASLLKDEMTKIGQEH